MNVLLAHFRAKDEFDLAVLLINGALALAIFYLLFFARTATPDPWSAAMAERGLRRIWAICKAIATRIPRYAFTAIYFAIAVRVACGRYLTPVEPTEVAINAYVLWVVWLVRGDLSQLVLAVRFLQVPHRAINEGRRKDAQSEPLD